jgi:hypothetical protein
MTVRACSDSQSESPNGEEANVARKTPHSLTTNGQAAVKKARGTWHDVQSSLESAADLTQSVAESATETVKGARRETAKRANAARDALAGRQRPRRRWTVIAAMASAGLGAAAGAVGARLLRRIKDDATPGTHTGTETPTTPASARQSEPAASGGVIVEPVTVTPITSDPATEPIRPRRSPDPLTTAPRDTGATPAKKPVNGINATKANG